MERSNQAMQELTHQITDTDRALNRAVNMLADLNTKRLQLCSEVSRLTREVRRERQEEIERNERFIREHIEATAVRFNTFDPPTPSVGTPSPIGHLRYISPASQLNLQVEVSPSAHASDQTLTVQDDRHAEREEEENYGTPPPPPGPLPKSKRFGTRLRSTQDLQAEVRRSPRLAQKQPF